MLRLCIHHLLVGILLCLSPAVTAQQEQVWIFGHGAGLDFNYGNPVPVQSAITGFGEGCASVCDTSGQLLFYSDGDTLWNRNHIPMANGLNITGLDADSGYSATSSASQGALIVAMPDSIHKFYLFSLTAFEQGVHMGRLYYSVVNMALNNGLGDVEPGRKGILLDSNLTEQMTGVMGSRCNLWVVVVPRINNGQGNQFKSFEITTAGVNPIPIVSTIGGTFTGYLSFGKINISPDRRKLAIGRSNPLLSVGSLELYDLDAATGIISNPMFLDPGFDAYYGVCFAPGSTKLYVNRNAATIQQYDISSNDLNTIINSETLVCTSPFTDIKRAPDGKLYYISNETTNYLGAIQFPNLAGSSCQPDANAVQLLAGTSMHAGLPGVVPVLYTSDEQQNNLSKAGCFATNHTIMATDTSGWDYTWEDGSTGIYRTLTAPGAYVLQYYTAPCVHHLDSFEVSFPGGTLPNILTRSSCNNTHNGKAWVISPAWDSVQYNYSWYNAADSLLSVTDSLMFVGSGLYSLRITGSNNCDTILPVFIPEEEHMVSFEADSLACTGELLSFTNTSGNYFSTYTWDFGDNNGSTLISPTHTYIEAGQYHLQLIGIGDICTDTLHKTITIDAPLGDLYFHKDKDSICTGQSVTFSPSSDSTTLRLLWQLDDSDSLITGNETISHAYDKAGRMPLLLRADFRACPSLMATDTISVFPLPLVNLGPDTVLCLDGHAIVLTSSGPQTPGSRFLWNTGATTPLITVKHPGIYNLSITNEQGCTGTESITVNKDCYIDIPNAFTPNHDGVNDYFFPRQLLSHSITHFRMKIMNRWGQLIFETDKTDGRGWDGSFNGKEQTQGVYVYLIDMVIDNDKPEHYQGNVTLLR